MKTKRIITALLTVVMLLGMIPFSAFAADWGEGDTLDDALSELKVGFNDKLLDWLVLPNLGVIYQRYAYFYFNNQRTGTKDAQPVYCIDPTKSGAYEIVRDVGPNTDGSSTATYIRGDKVGDAKYKAILSAGYPHMRLTGLGLQTPEEGYYATKLALWMYIRGNDPTKLTINPKYGSSDPVALRVRNAAVDIYTRGTTGSPVAEPRLTLTGKPSATARLDANGEYYVQEVEVFASGWIGTNPDASGDVQLSWQSPPPAGTIVLGSNGENITSTMNVVMSHSNGWYGKVTIKYPASSVTPETFSPPTLKASAIVPNDEIYVAYAKINKDKYQRYLVERDPKILLTASFVSQLNIEPGKDFPTDSGLRIRKVETGTDAPLAGAVFEILDPEGRLIYSLATDNSGIIDIPLAVAGNYTVTEVTPPQYHLLPEKRTQSVTVRYGEVSEVTFTNAPYGALRVVKRDASNGMPLGGAAVRIRNITTNATQEMFTDSSGSAYFDRLPVGAYEIVEITAPDGYALDSTVHTVNVLPLTEGETSYGLTNKANPGLRITKFDRQTMRPIAGVSFEVWKDGELYGTYVTDAWGEIELRNLPAGTYTAREIAVPEPYVLDPTAQWVELKAGQGYISELLFFNLEKPGIRLIKVDSETLAPLLGARYEIAKVGGSFVGEYVTGQNGEIDLSGLEPGAYTVKELAAPDGYLIDDAIRIVQINAGENAQFVFTDTRKPTIEIVKYDAQNGVYVAGATIRIAKIEDGTHYLDRVTDVNGKISISGLEPGVYSVQEIAAPGGYVLNEKEYHVELFPGRTSQLVMENVKKPSLIIRKYDMDTAKPLPDAEFSIAKKGGSIIYEGVTNGSGYIRLDNLDVGWYTITEIAPPPGYLITTPSKDVYLEAGKTVEIKFDDLKCPVLTINKVDSITKDGLKGATFNIRFSPDVNFTGGVIDLGNYTTDNNGQIILNDNLKAGWYRVTEIAAPAGYNLADPATQDIFIAGGKGKTLTFENVPKSALIIRKIDSATGLPVQGAAFRVRYLAGESGSGGTIIFEGVTSHNGTIVLTGLKAGTYIAEEYRAAPGYELSNPSEKTAYISGKEQDVIELEFTNAKKGEVLIQKLDSITKQPLKGAEFKVTDSSGAVIGPNNGIYKTDASGLINLSEYLSVGSTIVVQEIKAPDGYVLDTNAQTLKIKENTTHMLTFYNTQEGGLQIIKLDEESRQPIEGVEFEVSRMNGERMGRYRTNKSGIIFLPLEAGWYTVVERSVREPYKLDETPRNIEVKDGKTATLTITNRKQTNIMIHKVDSVTGKGIYGVQFLIMDANKNPLTVIESDQSGYVYVPQVGDGKFYLREIRAAEGYEIDEEIKTIYISGGETSHITWKNKPILAQIQVIKYSSDYNPVTGTPAGSLLKGAVFEISNARSGVVIGYITSDARGVAASEPLPLARYIVKEVSAPPFYQLSNEPFDITLEYPGQIVRVSAYNKSAQLGTTIKKTGNVEVKAGDSMRYDFSNIANTSNVPLSDFYWSDRIPTDAVRAQTFSTGTYSQRVYYRVLYKTNYAEWRVLASNLISTNNYSFNLTSSALGLMGGEVVTDVKLEFGTVEVGFTSATKPMMTVLTLPTLPAGYQITNRCEVGGRYQGAWQTSQSVWITRVVRYGPVPSLPKTGY